MSQMPALGAYKKRRTDLPRNPATLLIPGKQVFSAYKRVRAARDAQFSFQEGMGARLMPASVLPHIAFVAFMTRLSFPKASAPVTRAWRVGHITVLAHTHADKTEEKCFRGHSFDAGGACQSDRQSFAAALQAWPIP